MKKVLVQKALKPQIDSSGKMSYVMDVGGGNRGSARAPLSLREKLGGALGRLVGVTGAFTGKHRNISSLLGSAYAGGMQGADIGRGLAGKTVSRARRAQLKEQEDRLAAQAQQEGQRRFRENRPIGIRARNARMLAAEDEALARAGSAEEELRASQAAQKRATKIGRDFRVAQDKAARREVSREDMARARQLREYTPEQLERFRQIDPEGLARLERVASVIMPNAYNLLPSLGQQFPNAQPSQIPVPPLTTAPGAQTALQRGEQVPEQFDDHSSQDQGLAAQLGQQVAQEEEPVMGLSAEELQNALRVGLNGQG
jgi:hypothetical protein